MICHYMYDITIPDSIQLFLLYHFHLTPLVAVNLFILAAINFRVLPTECQFIAIHVRVSMACLMF